jgi:hypothetical protein
MLKRATIAVLIAICVLGGFSCRKKTQAKGIELSVNFADKNLTDNLMTEIQYKWRTGPDFVPLGKDMMVSVHFWHKTNLLFQDDYYPDPPPSKWEPGKEYVTVHKIYIPSFIDEFDPQFKGEEKLRLSIGLYSPYDRTGKSKIQVLDKEIKVGPPPPDTPEITYQDGWYNLETNPKVFYKQWRWTAGEAKCLIDNPHRDATLVIRGAGNPYGHKDQKVIFKINDTVLDEFIPDTDTFEKTYGIKKEMLGNKDEFTLTVGTDKTYVPSKLEPSSTDNRELGVLIYLIYFR